MPGPDKWLTIWWLAASTGLSHADLAKHFGLTRGRISQMVGRAQVYASEDPSFAQQMATLRASL